MPTRKFSGQQEPLHAVGGDGIPSCTSAVQHKLRTGHLKRTFGVTNPAKKNVVDTSDVSKLYLYEVDGGHAQAKRRSALLVMMAALAAAAVFRLR